MRYSAIFFLTLVTAAALGGEPSPTASPTPSPVESISTAGTAAEEGVTLANSFVRILNASPRTPTIKLLPKGEFSGSAEVVPGSASEWIATPWGTQSFGVSTGEKNESRIAFDLEPRDFHTIVVFPPADGATTATLELKPQNDRYNLVQRNGSTVRVVNGLDREVQLSFHGSYKYRRVNLKPRSASTYVPLEATSNEVSILTPQGDQLLPPLDMTAEPRKGYTLLLIEGTEKLPEARIIDDGSRRPEYWRLAAKDNPRLKNRKLAIAVTDVLTGEDQVLHEGESASGSSDAPK